jgi:hypothetical protein
VQISPNRLQAGQGSGLGLWITKSIIEMHGGKVWMYSDGVGRGATFFLELPLVAAVVDGEVSQHEADLEKGDTTPSLDYADVPTGLKICEVSSTEFVSTKEEKSHCHILVVDDAPSNRKVLCRILERKGYVCSVAIDGLDCLEKLESPDTPTVHCIAMDFQMPNVSYVK